MVGGLGLELVSDKQEELPQGIGGSSAQVALDDIRLASIVEVMRESRYNLPPPMRRIIVPKDRPINGLSLPVIAVSADQLERKPDINKAAIDQDNPQFVHIWDECFYHNVRELDFSDVAEVFYV